MKKRAIFLDRDGTVLTLFEGTGYLKHPKDVRFLPDAAKAIVLLQKAGYLIFLHTNQANIARGELTEQQLEKIHAVVLNRLHKYGATIDAIYYCPHHPKGRIKKYAIVCSCRKPKAGMIQKAIRKFNLEPQRSYMIGDSNKDILAGKRAHLKTILVQTGNAGKEPGAPRVMSDAIAKNLFEAAKYLKKNATRRSQAKF